MCFESVYAACYLPKVHFWVPVLGAGCATPSALFWPFSPEVGRLYRVLVVAEGIYLFSSITHGKPWFVHHSTQIVARYSRVIPLLPREHQLAQIFSEIPFILSAIGRIVPATLWNPPCCMEA
jgi:hypothetical protein